MSDLIDRQAAINLLKKWSDGYDYIDTETESAIKDFQQLPSAQPERKNGKWVWKEDEIDWGLGAWCCSECGRKPETWWESDKRNNPLRCAGSKFCGNCGVYMIGEEDEHND